MVNKKPLDHEIDWGRYSLRHGSVSMNSLQVSIERDDDNGNFIRYTDLLAERRLVRETIAKMETEISALRQEIETLRGVEK